MAITINDQPGNTIRAAYDDFTITATSTQVSSNYFKFVYDVYIDNVFQVRVKASPGNNNRGVVNVKDIIKDFVNTDIKGNTSTFKGNSFDHSIHQIDKYSENVDNLVRVKVLLGEEYASSSTGTVQLYDGAGSLGNPSVTTNDFYVFNAVKQIGIHSTSSLEAIDFDITNYILGDATKEFLTELDASVRRKIRSTDYHTVAGFNGTWGAVNSDFEKIFVREYNAAGTQIASQSIDNTSANGGEPPASSNEHDQGLLYVGVGPQNFSNTGYTFNASTVSYSVEVLDAGTNTSMSKKYYFDIIDNDCKGYETIRLAWLNRLGAWDYYCFTKKSTKNVKVRKKLHRKTIGNWADNPATGYTYSQYERGNGVVAVSALEQFEANTDFISEQEAIYLESLFTSPNVYMIDADDVMPVIVNDTGYTKQSLANDQLMQYSISIEKAHKLVIQQG